MVDLTTQQVKRDLMIRPYIPSDLSEIISLIGRSDSTDRTELTWSKNHMTGILGFEGKKLIGAIPFEPRNFVLGNGEYSKVLWVSAAHVDSEYRSMGLGGKMDKVARENFYPDYEAIFVYRGDENSLAYKWYSRLGYYDILRILSFKIDVRQVENRTNYHCYSSLDELKNIENEIFKCYHLHYGDFGGSPYRHKSFWSEKIFSHYYQNYNRYFIIVLHHEGEVESYAVLGKTKFRDCVERFEILEYCCPDENKYRNRLVTAVMAEAYKRGLKEVRIQLSNQDPGLQYFEEYGFYFSWRTNLIGILIRPEEFFINRINKSGRNGDYQIIFETPSLGVKSIGCGPNKLGLFFSDNEFVRLLLLRTHLMTAIEEGRILVTQNNKAVLNIVETIFPLKKWLYHQIDYI